MDLYLSAHLIFFIGTYTLEGSYYFDGVIDDLRKYYSTLSASDVSALYHSGGW